VGTTRVGSILARAVGAREGGRARPHIEVEDGDLVRVRAWVDRLHGAPSRGGLAEEKLSHAHDCHGGLADVQNGTDL
jgi:hypothetical protein